MVIELHHIFWYNNLNTFKGFFMKINFAKILEQKIKEIESSGKRPKLLLHVCCAPCSSYVLEYLSVHFDITLFFYNPNISPEVEFNKRLSELEKFCEMAGYSEITIASPMYDSRVFFDSVRGMESSPEGGDRCKICYELRLRKCAAAALEGRFDYFTTTLSISPYKNAEWLNEIGKMLENEYGVPYLYSDFKKKNGYKRSIELSNKYGLYRQDYCGCIFSKLESEKKRADT